MTQSPLDTIEQALRETHAAICNNCPDAALKRLDTALRSLAQLREGNGWKLVDPHPTDTKVAELAGLHGLRNTHFDADGNFYIREYVWPISGQQELPQATNDDIRAWIDQHDLRTPLGEARCAFEDAQSWKPEAAAPTPPAQAEL